MGVPKVRYERPNRDRVDPKHFQSPLRFVSAIASDIKDKDGHKMWISASMPYKYLPIVTFNVYDCYMYTVSCVSYHVCLCVRCNKQFVPNDLFLRDSKRWIDT